MFFEAIAQSVKQSACELFRLLPSSSYQHLPFSWRSCVWIDWQQRPTVFATRTFWIPVLLYFILPTSLILVYKVATIACQRKPSQTSSTFPQQSPPLTIPLTTPRTIPANLQTYISNQHQPPKILTSSVSVESNHHRRSSMTEYHSSSNLVQQHRQLADQAYQDISAGLDKDHIQRDPVGALVHYRKGVRNARAALSIQFTNREDRCVACDV